MQRALNLFELGDVMDEEQAIVQLKQGNMNGLEFLVNRYYFKAVHTAYLIVRDQFLAEDVVQTVFLELPKKIKQFNSNSAFKPWFLRCIVNAAKNAAYKQARVISLDGDFENVNDSMDALFQNSELLPEDQIVTEEIRQTVWDALGQLNPQQRAVIVMHYYLQMDENEMVSEMDRPKSSIKWWLHTARESLKVKLNALKPERETTYFNHDEPEKKE